MNVIKKREKKRLVIVRRQEQTQRPTAIGAYIFAGLFTLGVREHFKVLAHLEDGRFGTETARRNFPETKVYEKPEQWPLVELKKTRPDFVYANPPCAPWSAAGRGGESWRTDPRTSCVRRSVGLLYLNPKILVIESVRQLYTKGREMVDELVLEAMKAGYSVTHLFVNAANHGVPQFRPRYFMVCHRVETRFTPTGVAPMSVAAALAEAEPGGLQASMPPGWAPMVPLLPKGRHLIEVWKSVTENSAASAAFADRVTKPGKMINRLRPDRPDRVIIGTTTRIHPVEHRFVSINELKALCRVPKEFELVGGVSSATAQLGRGVMPPVGEYVAARAAEAIRRDVKISRPTVREIEVGVDLVSVRQLVTPSIPGK